jgi:hypothetical protein
LSRQQSDVVLPGGGRAPGSCTTTRSPESFTGAKISLNTAGLLSSAGSQFILQPGTSYDVDLSVTQLANTCPGTSTLGEPNIGFLVLPVPAS